MELSLHYADRKYPRWGSFLKEKRLRKFRSAREFCLSLEVGISYPQYSRYEAGEQLPNLPQTLRLSRLLGFSPLEGILEWSRAQIPEGEDQSEIEAILSEVRQKAIAAAQGSVPNGRSTTNGSNGSANGLDRSPISLDDVIVFNRAHLEVFRCNPLYRDLFTYINAYAPAWISEAELCRAFGVSSQEIAVLLDQLTKMGVILQGGDSHYRASKSTFYFPDDEDFFDLRNMNFSHNVEKLMGSLKYSDLARKAAVRTVVTRELTSQQLEAVFQSLEKLLSQMVSLPETHTPESVYSLCVLFGERFSRAKVENSPISQDTSFGNA